MATRQYTREQAIGALNAAAKAGDNTAANEWANYLDAMQGAPEASPTAAEAPKEESLYAGMLDSVKAVPKLAFDTLRSGMDGVMFGGFDEAASGLQAGATVAKDALMGNTDGPSFDEAYAAQMQYEAEDRERFDEEHAYLSAGAEITGAILSPISKALAGVKVVATGAKGSAILNPAAQGTAAAVPYVLLDTNGNLTDRVDAASSAAVPAAMMGVVGGKVMSVSTDVFKYVYQKYGTKAGVVSTTATLKAQKDAAYELVEKSNIRFSSFRVSKARKDFDAKVSESLSNSDYSTAQKEVGKLLDKITETSRGKGAELTQLDKTQQALWKKYKTAKAKGETDDQSVILDAVNMIDDLISGHPSTDEVMSVARLTNRRFRKAETIDRISEKIAVNESFKGASKVDQMKAALAKIMANPRDAKHFDDVEIARFKEFIADDGTMSQKVLGALGTLAPSSQLTMLLHASGASASLATGSTGALAAQGVASVAALGAKKYAQRAQKNRTGAFTSEMQGNARKAPATTGVGTVAAAPQGMLTGQMREDDQRNMSMLKRKSAF